MPKFKNIRIRKPNGGTRLQRVQVLRSGKYKFVKNTKRKVKRKTNVRRTTKRKIKRRVTKRRVVRRRTTRRRSTGGLLY